VPRNTVLILDDDPLFLQYYRKLFTPRDHSVPEVPPLTPLACRTFTQPEELLQAYAAQSAQGKFSPLCILDMRLPDTNGVEIAKQLRTLDANLDIVICTAFTDISARELHDQLEQRVYLVRKPFEADEFVLLIESLVDAWTTRQGLAQMQADLSAQHRRLENIMEATRVATWETDLRTGASRVNARWAEMTGHTLAELAPITHDTWMRLCHPDDLDRVLYISQRHLAGELDYYEAEYRLQHKNGSVVWVLDRGRVVQRDANGKAILMAGTHADITRRKNVEADLRKLSRAVEQSPTSVVITDTHGRIEYVNPQFVALTGYTIEEAIGQNPRILRAETTPDPKYQELWTTILHGQTWKGEFHNRKKNGEEYWESALISPIIDDQGTITNFLAVKENITERKLNEVAMRKMHDDLTVATTEAKRLAVEAEKANLAKGQFLANMSHEIRTPMNGVIGMIGLLMDTALTDEQRRFAETCRNSAESLLAIINDILDLSKIEAGKLDLETIDFNLEDVLDECTSMLAFRALDKDLEFICAATPGVPTRLQGDPGRLRQILLNLAGNAIKFTATGEVSVAVSVQEQSASHAVLHFRVRDTGIGIPLERQSQLFQNFVQLDASTTRKYGGTGLGLAISKQLAELMDGQIGVASAPGGGSEFWFTARFRKQPAQKLNHANHTELPDLRGQAVLVVDDNATNCAVLAAQLRGWGAQPTVAQDGPTALRLIYEAQAEGRPFPLAILDMQMPGMDGESLGRAIRADHKLAQTRLVLMTSMSQRGDRARYQILGFSGYISKPIRQSELYNSLTSTLAGNRIHPPATDGSGAHTPPQFPAHLRLLLAEDNIINQKVAVGILSKYGLNVETVVNGAEAIAALSAHSYDLVLMDVQMPDMNGYEATAIIRDPKSTVRNHDIPVIAMTAHAMEGDRDKCLAAGMNDYVSKPIKPQALAATLAKWLPGQPA
jgi:two-component system sensor histidine kinase/response regulator